MQCNEEQKIRVLHSTICHTSLQRRNWFVTEKMKFTRLWRRLWLWETLKTSLIVVAVCWIVFLFVCLFDGCLCGRGNLRVACDRLCGRNASLPIPNIYIPQTGLNQNVSITGVGHKSLTSDSLLNRKGTNLPWLKPSIYICLLWLIQNSIMWKKIDGIAG